MLIRCNGLKRGVRTAAVCSSAFAVMSGMTLPAAAVEVTDDDRPGILGAGLPLPGDIDGWGLRRGNAAALPNDTRPALQQTIKMAQFQLPVPAAEGSAAAAPLPTRLTYQYAIGSESDITYRRDPDLNKGVRDNTLILVPQMNGNITYRPTDWLETTLELILEKEIAAQEERMITLPSGETRFAEKRRFSLVLDQAYVTIKGLAVPFDFTLGRKNFEDERHWLYDTSLDVALVKFKQGYFQAEASFGRKDSVNLDLLKPVEKGRIDNAMLTMRYRGIEDLKLAAYAVLRDDRAGQEGRPLLIGVSAQRTPSEKFNYWTELAFLRGSDALSRKFSAHAFDVGATYQFTDIRFKPNLTLGYAFATGDGNPDDDRNHEFRQTGLQSNESKFAGISKFKTYGEVLDPELSNLGILTVGLGLRPAPNVSIDLVYHRYRLDQIAATIRNSPLTAEMNQVETRLSKDVGSALDLVLAFRNVFGVRRLGVDLRLGWFFPGDAFLRNDGDENKLDLRRADKGFSVFAKFWF